MSYFIRFRVLSYKSMLIASKKSSCLLLISLNKNYSKVSFLYIFP